MNPSIRNVMSSNPVYVNSQQTIQEAAALMELNDTGAIPVVENDQIIGIITDRDITLRATAQGRQPNTQVSDCMSNHLTVADVNMDIHEAANMMSQQQIRRLPVVENNQLVGMLSIGDLANETIFQNEAGEALSNISAPTQAANNI